MDNAGLSVQRQLPLGLLALALRLCLAVLLRGGLLLLFFAITPEEEATRSALAQYRFNREVIRQLGRSFGIDTYQFLQPVPGYGTYRVETSDLGACHRAFYDALVRRHGEVAHDELLLSH